MSEFILLVFVVILAIGIIIQGCVDSNGIVASYEAARDSGRLNFFVATGDLTVRVDTVSAWLGQLFISLSIYGCQQSYLQRFISLDSIGRATW